MLLLSAFPLFPPRHCGMSAMGDSAERGRTRSKGRGKGATSVEHGHTSSSKGKGRDWSESRAKSKNENRTELDYLKKKLKEQQAENDDLKKKLALLTDKIATLIAMLGGKGEVPTKDKIDVPDPDQDDFVNVEAKKKGKNKKEVNKEIPTEEQAKTLPVLVQEDWPVPIIETSAFCSGADGVAMTSQAEGERIAREMVQCKGKLAILTPKLIPETIPREMNVKVRLANGRLDYRTKYFTCVGDKDFKPTYEKTNLVSECTLKLTNKTKRTVLQLQERFADKKMVEESVKNFYLPFDG